MTLSDGTWNTDVSVARCPICKESVYSRYLFDTRTCRCGKVQVSGGSEFFEVILQPELSPDAVFITQINLPVTKEQLYIDWATATNKYGIIQEPTKGEEIGNTRNDV